MEKYIPGIKTSSESHILSDDDEYDDDAPDPLRLPALYGSIVFDNRPSNVSPNSIFFYFFFVRFAQLSFKRLKRFIQ